MQVQYIQNHNIESLIQQLFQKSQQKGFRTKLFGFYIT